MTDESDENADQHDVLQLPLAAEDYVTVELEGGRLVDTVLVSPGDGDCAMTAYFSEPSSVDPVCIGGASGSENEAEAISIGSDCGSGVTQSCVAGALTNCAEVYDITGSAHSIDPDQADPDPTRDAVDPDLAPCADYVRADHCDYLVLLPDGSLDNRQTETDVVGTLNFDPGCFVCSATDQLQLVVPDAVAAETVVTTATQRPRRKQAFVNIIRRGVCDDDVLLQREPPDSDAAMAAVADGIVSRPDDLSVLGFVLPHSKSCVVIDPTIDVSSRPKTGARCSREAMKRERDKLKKRELRQNSLFREREKAKSCERMKQRRCDPTYRDVERRKDRWRRQVSRQQDESGRQRERERDKGYRRRQREVALGAATLSAATATLDATLDAAATLDATTLGPGRTLAIGDASNVDVAVAELNLA